MSNLCNIWKAENLFKFQQYCLNAANRQNKLPENNEVLHPIISIQ